MKRLICRVLGHKWIHGYHGWGAYRGTCSRCDEVWS